MKFDEKNQRRKEVLLDILLQIGMLKKWHCDKS